MKKRYMILSLAVVSILLGSLFYSNMVLSKEEKEPTPVKVKNFPVTPEPKTIVVCQNLTLTAPWDYDHIFATANVEGYRYVSIFVAYYRPYFNDGYILCQPSAQNITSGYEGGQAGVFHTRSIWYQLTIEWVHRSSIGFEVGAPNLAFRIWLPTDSIELTIVLYCYNN